MILLDREMLDVTLPFTPWPLFRSAGAAVALSSATVCLGNNSLFTACLYLFLAEEESYAISRIHRAKHSFDQVFPPNKGEAVAKLSSSVREQRDPCASECQGGGGVPSDRTSPVACADAPRMPMDGPFTNADTHVSHDSGAVRFLLCPSDAS